MTLLALIRSPKGEALIGMAVASALHFAGYECSRSAIIAMFTSQKTGFTNDEALPFATGCISPFSVLLLWMYTSILGKEGPRIALRKSTLICVANLIIGGIIMGYTQSRAEEESLFIQNISRTCIFLLFVSQNAFVQLLFTQHWAFLGSLGKGSKDGSAWFAPVAGIGSVSSTLAASAVGSMADAFSLPGLLLFAAVIMLSSGVAADFAYAMAEKNGFDPHEEQKSSSKVEKKPTSPSLLGKSRDLFERVPILGVLSRETVFCQCLSALVTFLFLKQVKQMITNDQERAGWTGNCYAWINGASGLLQFCIIPVLVPFFDPRRLWPLMPLIMLVFTLYMSLAAEHNLAIVALAFCMMKTMEYSLRGVLNEMTFASLDYESRYVAKQEIALLANRFSKSFTAVVLSLLSKYVLYSKLQGFLSWTASILAALWLIVSYQLTALIFAKGVQQQDSSKSKVV